MPIERPSAAAIERAAQLLRQGALVAFPTETVYGLGADATNGIAVARIFEAKGRPRFNPLIVHVASLAEAAVLGEITRLGGRLAEAFWPGPLTLVLRRRLGCAIADLATAGLDTVALRVPAHPVAAALLREAGCPIAAPSANRSGHVSPTTAAHVEADLGGRVAMILDGGPTAVGIESSVVDVTGPRPRLLRAGGVTSDEIERVAAVPLERALDGGAQPASPGQLASHYAPRAPIRLAATNVLPGEALLAFGPQAVAHAGPTINLSPTGDLVEAAANLFSALRALDSARPVAIAVMPIPRHGLGEAITDRLARAAAPRAGM